jgi:succinate dehydrogenase / fumarate reductase cytochrome b subunit
MIWSGLIIFAFVAFHLAHYTLMVVHPEFRDLRDANGWHDIYRMMIIGFSNYWVSGFYVLGIGLLCIHLSHGGSAMFQSLGLNNAAYEAVIDRLATVAAVVIFLGYISIPLAVLAGAVQ